MQVVEIASDPRVWAKVPLEYPAGPFATQDEWAEAVADAFSQNTRNPRAASDAIVSVARLLPAAPAPGLFALYWHLKDPFHPPLTARVIVAPMDAAQATAEGLHDVAGAHDPSCVRPPTLGSFRSRLFGTVFTVQSELTGSGSGTPVLRLTAIGHVDGLTVMIDAGTTDVRHGQKSRKDLDNLMKAVSVTNREG